MTHQGEGPLQAHPDLSKAECPRLEPSENGGIPKHNGNSVKTKKRKIPELLVPVILFLLTSITTLLAGAYQVGSNPFRNPSELSKGIPFAFTLLLILFCHEMGHYLTSKKYGVETSPPYFIPGPWFPFGIGTFGAFIRIKSPIFQKRALLNIGAAGPIAGFVVSVVAVFIGLKSSQIIAMTEGSALLRLGDPLIFTLISDLVGKTPPANHDIALDSVAFAGWIGLFVTTLNLLPIGQLDGGHIIYALVGKKSKYVSVGSIVVLVLMGTVAWKGWFVWAILTALIGVRHPPVIDEYEALDFKHRLVAAASVLIFILTFMPNPFMAGF